MREKLIIVFGLEFFGGFASMYGLSSLVLLHS